MFIFVHRYTILKYQIPLNVTNYTPPHEKKRKKRYLAAETMTRLPAPEVNDAASNYEPTFWTSSRRSSSHEHWLFCTTSFYDFKLHVYTSLSLVFVKHPTSVLCSSCQALQRYFRVTRSTSILPRDI